MPDNAAEITNLIDVLDSPYAIQISQYEAPFVMIEAYAHAGELDLELKKVLTLFIGLIFGTDLQRGEQTIKHQQVEQEMDRETNGYHASLFPRSGVVSVEVSVEKKKFLKGLQYVKEALTQQVYTQERLQHLLTSFNNSFSSKMKSSSRVMEHMMTSSLLKNESLDRLVTFISQYKTLKALDDDVRGNDAVETLAKFKKITEFITNPNNLIFHIAGDVKAIAEMLKKDHRKDLQQVLDEHFGDFRRTGDPAERSVCEAYRPFSENLLPVKPGTASVKVLSMGTEETANLDMTSVSQLPKNHPDLAVLRVIGSYLNMMEGPLWKQIRGLGLAYGFHFGYSPSRGFANFGANEATDVVQAFKEVKKFVDSLADDDDDVDIDELTLESAKSTLLFSLIAESEKPYYIAAKEMSNCFDARPLNYVKDLMDKALRVSKADMKRVLREHVQPLFSVKGSATILVAANPSKVTQISEGFKQLGLDVEKIDVEKMNPEEMR